MKSFETSRGVLGRAQPLPDHGAISESSLEDETKWQSCPTEKLPSSTQIRIRLSPIHAKQWLALPPRLREQVASIVFGSFIERVDLAKLAEVASELKLTRLAINNALQLALSAGTSPDSLSVENAVRNINNLLGEKMQ